MIDVYLEIGQKRVIAGALEWPGWCRAGRDFGAALEALVESAPRYAALVAPAGLGFVAPADVRELRVVDRLAGTNGTDFGAPDVAPPADLRPLDEAGLARLTTLLHAYWAAFDAAVAGAWGIELRKGPRGGGRELDGIVEHVRGAEQGYLRARAWKLSKEGDTRQGVIGALEAAVRGEEPASGPRGGKIWPARYFARRVAYHVIDHIWEIEDRAAAPL